MVQISANDKLQGQLNIEDSRLARVFMDRVAESHISSCILNLNSDR